MNLQALLQIVIALFLLLATGYLCRRIGIVDDNSSKKFSRLILEIGQPAMIISALLRADRSPEHISLGFTVLWVGFLLHLALAGMAFLFAKAIRSPEEEKLTEFSLIFTNCGFIGFPILESVFGTDGRFMGAFFIISFNVLIWTWGIVILARDRKDIKLTPKKALFNLGTIPCAIGIGIYLSQIPIPPFVDTFAGFLSNLCTPISVIITGALIATRPLKELFLSAKLYYQSAAKLILLPLLVAILTKGIMTVFSLPNPQIWVIFTTLMSSLPSATTVIMLSERYDLPGGGYASQSVGLSSVLSLITLPCMLWIAERIAVL